MDKMPAPRSHEEIAAEINALHEEQRRLLDQEQQRLKELEGTGKRSMAQLRQDAKANETFMDAMFRIGEQLKALYAEDEVRMEREEDQR